MWKLARAAAGVAAAVAALNCGTAADPGHEKRGTDSLPTAGVAPWLKIDVDGDISNLTQPIVLAPRFPSESLREPFVARVGEEFWMWLERRTASGDGGEEGGTSEILLTRASSPTGFLQAGPGEVVLRATENWEGGRVGAPSVVIDEAADPSARFRMWYEGGGRRGIGYATSPDGVRWARQAGRGPVLVASEDWEEDGAGEGRVGSPSVVLVKGELRMWYDGGDRAGIGSARSAEGIAWTKEDASGRRSARDSPRVEPVLVPGQPWEGSITEPHETGHVRAPQVFYDTAAFEPTFKMYYTGFLPVSENPLVHVDIEGTTPGTTNESVGFAGSRDGLSWTEADASMNAVLSEELPISLGNLPFPEALLETLPRLAVELLKAILGQDEQGNPKIPDFQVIYDESEGAVLRDGDRYLMWFVQQNSIFIPLALALPESPFTTELGILIQGTERGIGAAGSPS